jgi:hypothetical protein
MPALKMRSITPKRRRKGKNGMKYDFDDFTTLQILVYNTTREKVGRRETKGKEKQRNEHPNEWVGFVRDL